MSRAYDLLIRARGETKDAERAMKQLQRSVDQFGRRTRNVGLALTAGITVPLLALGKMGVGELGQIEKANIQTSKALARVGSSSKISAANITQMAAALQAKSGIDDQAIQNAENLVVTLSGLDLTTKLGADSFKKASGSMVDFADTMGIDVTAAAKLYSKSIAAAGQGTILLPKGVKLSADEMSRLKKSMEGASTAGEKQALVIEALSQKFKGGADLTNSDKWAVAMDRLAGSAAELVVMLLPAFDKLVGVIGKVTGWFGQLDPQAKKLVGTGLLLAGALGPALILLGSLVSAGSALLPVLLAITGPVALVIAGIAALGAALTVAYIKNDKFRASVNDAFKGALATIRSALASMRQLIQEFTRTASIAWERWGADLMGVAKPYLSAVATFVGTWVRNIRDAIRIVLALIRGDWGSAWDLLKGIVGRSLAAAASIAKSAGKAVISAVKSIGSGLLALGGWFLDKGMELGKAIIRGIKNAISNGAGAIADAAQNVASSALDKITFDVPGIKSGKGRKGGARAAKSGVSVLGALFGPGVTAGQVMGYTALEGADAYSTTSNADGTSTVNRNEAVIAFLESRKKANEALLAGRLKYRKGLVARGVAARKAWLAAKRSRAASAAARAARVKRVSAAFDRMMNIVNELDGLDAEILALGGAIEDDANALIAPEADTTPNETGAGDSAGSTSVSGDSSAASASLAAQLASSNANLAASNAAFGVFSGPGDIGTGLGGSAFGSARMGSPTIIFQSTVPYTADQARTVAGMAAQGFGLDGTQQRVASNPTSSIGA